MGSNISRYFIESGGYIRVWEKAVGIISGWCLQVFMILLNYLVHNNT